MTSNYFYQSGTGNLTEERFQYGTESQVVTTYQYFTEGNLQTLTVTPQNMAPRVSSYTYTTDRRFVKTETNPLGWETEYDYDHTLGVVTSQTDNENNLQTSVAHDDFGRITLTTYPDGNTESLNRVWDLATTFGQSLFYTETTGSNQPFTQKWYDGQVRQIRSKHKNRNDDWVFVRTIYDSKGRVWKKSLPYLSGGSMNYSVTTYDNYGRPLTKTSPNGTSISYAYSGRTVTTTNTSTNQSTSKTTDATGKLVSATDDGGSITYHYNSWGKPREVTAPASTITMEYDEHSGRQTSLADPAAGLMNYVYNTAGELIEQEDANGNIYEMTYDNLGRLVLRTGPEGDYEYTYDQSFVGKLYEASSPDGVTTTYDYDSFGRLSWSQEIIDSKSFEFSYNYDNLGNLQSIEYPHGLGINHTYDQYGYLIKIEGSDNNLVWEFIDENPLGQITEYGLGNNYTTTRSYNPISGLPDYHGYGNQIEYHYNFENSTGNLEERVNAINGVGEDFSYDGLDRLYEYNTSTGFSNNVEYSNSGDIDYKSDVGSYSNHAASGRTGEITDNPGTISDEQQIIEYTPFHSVRMIMEGDFDAEFIYGHDDQRRKMTISEAGAPYRERYYTANGLYEKDFRDGQWRHIAYVNTPTGAEAVYITEDVQGGDQNHELHFIPRDYLGSILAVCDENGDVLEEYSYDAWGNRRDPHTWENQHNPGQNTNLWNGLLSRGFTGHEHLDCFGLINMNGRLYDPLLGRMLSPDNYVQNASFSQNYNRYAYVYNNPLKYSDPDGEWVHIAIGAAVGGLINLGIKASQGEINSWGDGFAAFGIGAVAGAVGAATGGAAFAAVGTGGAAGGAIAGASGGIVGGFTQEFSNALYFDNANIGQAFGAGGRGALYGGIGGALIGGAIGGIQSGFSGQNFWTGKPVAPGRGGFSFRNTPKYTGANADYSFVGSDGVRRVVNPQTVSETLEGFNIYASPNNPIYKNAVDGYLTQIKAGSFDPVKHAVGGYMEGTSRAFVTSGHHRVVAATIHGMQSGDYSILSTLINAGRFTQVSGATYSTFSNFPIIWW